MADYTLSGAYQLADPGDGPATAPFNAGDTAILSVSLDESANIGDDSLTVLTAGLYPNMAARAAITVRVTKDALAFPPTGRPAAPQTFNIAGFTVESRKEWRYPVPQTELVAYRTIDKQAVTDDVLARLESDSLPTPLAMQRLYPLQNRWDGILRPTGHIADAPNIWAWIAEKVREGSQPNYRRLVDTLASFGLGIVRGSAAGYMQLTAGGVDVSIAPLNYRRTYGTPPAARTLALSDLAGGDGVDTADVLDETLDRRIRFTVPNERALFDDRRPDKTRIVYEGGTANPPLTLDGQERPALRRDSDGGRTNAAADDQPDD